MARTLPHQLLFVLFGCYLCCSMYCSCVNVYCHRVTTQLQLTNISYHIMNWKETRSSPGQIWDTTVLFVQNGAGESFPGCVPKLSINFEEFLTRAHGNSEDQNKVLDSSIIIVNYCIDVINNIKIIYVTLWLVIPVVQISYLIRRIY